MASAAFAQDSGPLLDLLVKKGIVNDQEAETLRAELVKDFAANTSAGKLNLSSSLAEFKLSGDIRLRHQYETQAPETSSGSSVVTNERTRERFRFRFNGDATLQKGWAAGFALETGQASDSGNQTFDGNNDDYGIYLARAYVSYRLNNSWLFVAGKQKNVLYATDLRWDADINPQGLAEVFTYTLSGKDTIEARALQSIVNDRRESVAGPNGRDAWLFEQQVVFTKWFGANSLVIAPGFELYNQSYIGVVGTDGVAPTNENAFSGSTRGQSYLTLAGEYNFVTLFAAGDSLKFYWDSSYNMEAGKRVYSVYGVANTFKKDPFAWLIGVGYSHGTGKLQGDYSAKLDYRQIGLGSVDVNSNDSDFAFGKLNQQGFKLALSYNLTDFANFNLNYFYTTAIQDKLTFALATVDHTQLFQADLVVKF